MSDAVEATILQALMGRLIGYVSASAMPVVGPNVAFDPPEGTYLKADLLWNRNINRGIADDSATEHRGIFQVTVVAPANSGIFGATNIAGGVAARFERGSIVPAGGLKVCIEGKPSLGPSPQNADRVRIPVSIRFYAFA